MKAKKVTALVLAGVLGAATLTGCGNKTVDADAIVAKMDDGNVRLGVANFMARYTQSAYDSIYVTYFGEDYWSQDMSGEGKTMEEDIKDDIMDQLKTYYALAAHMDEYDVKITKSDQKKIDKAAKEFIKANDKETVEAMSATEQDVAEYLRLVTIQQRMQEKIEADVDTNISDEEAAQRTFSYVEISTEGTTDEDGNTVEYSEEELTELKNKAEALAGSGAEGFETTAEVQQLDVETFSYKAGEEDEEMDQAVLTEADKLKEGEMSGVIETDTAYYVVRLDSEFDQEATDERKDEIVEERKAELYEKVCDEFTEDFKFKIDKDVWKSVSFEELFTMKEVESEDSEETEETEDTENTGETEETEDTESTEETLEEGDQSLEEGTEEATE